MTTAKELADQISKAMEGVPGGNWSVNRIKGYTVNYIVTDDPELAPTKEHRFRNNVAETGLTPGQSGIASFEAISEYLATLSPDNMRIILSALADAERERDELRVGIKRLSDEEELCSETDDGDAFDLVRLAAKLARSERKTRDVERELTDTQTAIHAMSEDHEELKAKLAEALALVPGEPVLHGPYGYLNGNRALSEDEWTLENDPIENSDEYFSIPLFAKIDIFSPAPHPSVDRDALLEEARRVIEPFQRLAASVFRFDEDGREMNATKADDRPLWGFDNTNITYGDLRAVRSFLSKLEASHAEA